MHDSVVPTDTHLQTPPISFVNSDSQLALVFKLVHSLINLAHFLILGLYRHDDEKDLHVSSVVAVDVEQSLGVQTPDIATPVHLPSDPIYYSQTD